MPRLSVLHLLVNVGQGLRVALVTDSKLVAILPKFASHFVAAEVKHFAYGDMQSAHAWVAED